MDDQSVVEGHGYQKSCATYRLAIVAFTERGMLGECERGVSRLLHCAWQHWRACRFALCISRGQQLPKACNDGIYLYQYQAVLKCSGRFEALLRIFSSLILGRSLGCLERAEPGLLPRTNNYAPFEGFRISIFSLNAGSLHLSTSRMQIRPESG